MINYLRRTGLFLYNFVVGVVAVAVVAVGLDDTGLRLRILRQQGHGILHLEGRILSGKKISIFSKYFFH